MAKQSLRLRMWILSAGHLLALPEYVLAPMPPNHLHSYSMLTLPAAQNPGVKTPQTHPLICVMATVLSTACYTSLDAVGSSLWLDEETSEGSTTSREAAVAIAALPFGAPAVQPSRTTMK
ncbi:unnamed protein product [Clonostachys solani]|uniref:Secreted protein n=1 Tax=Clonostachys solani TaxID=160281 RepID=A0A9N9Z0E7_9HYPO|nr:unnamed protein product [Clonostachys solani]